MRVTFHRQPYTTWRPSYERIDYGPYQVHSLYGHRLPATPRTLHRFAIGPWSVLLGYDNE